MAYLTFRPRETKRPCRNVPRFACRGGGVIFIDGGCLDGCRISSFIGGGVSGGAAVGKVRGIGGHVKVSIIGADHITVRCRDSAVILVLHFCGDGMRGSIVSRGESIPAIHLPNVLINRLSRNGPTERGRSKRIVLDRAIQGDRDTTGARICFTGKYGRRCKSLIRIVSVIANTGITCCVHETSRFACGTIFLVTIGMVIKHCITTTRNIVGNTVPADNSARSNSISLINARSTEYVFRAIGGSCHSSVISSPIVSRSSRRRNAVRKLTVQSDRSGRDGEGDSTFRFGITARSPLIVIRQRHSAGSTVRHFSQYDRIRCRISRAKCNGRTGSINMIEVRANEACTIIGRTDSGFACIPGDRIAVILACRFVAALKVNARLVRIGSIIRKPYSQILSGNQSADRDGRSVFPSSLLRFRGIALSARTTAVIHKIRSRSIRNGEGEFLLVDRPIGRGGREGIVAYAARTYRSDRADGNGVRRHRGGNDPYVCVREGDGAIVCHSRRGSIRRAVLTVSKGKRFALLNTGNSSHPTLCASVINAREAGGVCPRYRDGRRRDLEGSGLMNAACRDLVVGITQVGDGKGISARVLHSGAGGNRHGHTVRRACLHVGDAVGQGGTCRPGLTRVSMGKRSLVIRAGAVSHAPSHFRRALVDLPSFGSGARHFIVRVIQGDGGSVIGAVVHGSKVDLLGSLRGSKGLGSLIRARSTIQRDLDRAARSAKRQRDGVTALNVAGGKIHAVAPAVVSVLIGICHTGGVIPIQSDGTFDNMEGTAQVAGGQFIVLACAAIRHRSCRDGVIAHSACIIVAGSGRAGSDGNGIAAGGVGVRNIYGDAVAADHATHRGGKTVIAFIIDHVSTNGREGVRRAGCIIRRPTDGKFFLVNGKHRVCKPVCVCGGEFHRGSAVGDGDGIIVALKGSKVRTHVIGTRSSVLGGVGVLVVARSKGVAVSTAAISAEVGVSDRLRIRHARGACGDVFGSHVAVAHVGGAACRNEEGLIVSVVRDGSAVKCHGKAVRLVDV